MQSSQLPAPPRSFFPNLASFKISVIKGQLLEIEWPHSVETLPFALNSQAYLVSLHSGLSCYAGSTFERNFTSAEPDLESAKGEIMPKAAAMLPFLEQSKIIGHQAALRASTPTHLPYAEKVKDNLWILTGFGSKGLLYHALYAERLAQEIQKELF